MHETLGKLAVGGSGLERSWRAMHCPDLSVHLRVYVPTEGHRSVTLGSVTVCCWWEAVEEVGQHSGGEHRLRGKTDYDGGLARQLWIGDLAELQILSG